MSVKHRGAHEGEPLSAGTALTRRDFLRGCAAIGASGLLAWGATGCTASSHRGAGSAGDTAVMGSAGLSAASAPAELRIGYFQSPNAELLVKGRGDLQKALPRTKVSYVMFDAGRDILVAMASSSIDIATIGMPPGVLGMTDGLPYKIYYLHDIIGPSEALVAKKGSGIDAVGDLRGHTVATAFGTTAHYALLEAMKHAGVVQDELTLLDMTGPDIIAAWQRGDIDATYVWQPAQANLIAQGGKVVTDSARVARQTGSVTGEFGIARTAYAQSYPGVLKTYIDVLDKATGDYRTLDVDTVGTLAKELEMTDDAAAQIAGQIDVLDAAQQRAYFGDADKRGKLAGLLKRTNDYLYRQSSVTERKTAEFFDSMLLKGLYAG